MPETNPLVAERKDTTTPLAGTFLLEDGEALVQAINDKDWVAGGLAVVGGAFDAAAAASDPIGTLIAMGLGWVLDHVQPFNTWLEQLTGDADQVKAHATTWKNVQKHLQATAETMASHITTDLADMNGRTITAYQGAAGDMAQAINAAGTWAGAIGTALEVTAFIVQFVHDFVRDAISEVVGSILSYAAELIATVGLAWPIVAEQIATRIASLIGQVGRNVKNLVTSARNLVKKLTDLKSLFHTLKNKLDDLFKKLHKTDTPTTPTKGPTPTTGGNTSPHGDTGSTGGSSGAGNTSPPGGSTHPGGTSSGSAAPTTSPGHTGGNTNPTSGANTTGTTSSAPPTSGANTPTHTDGSHTTMTADSAPSTNNSTTHPSSTTGPDGPSGHTTDNPNPTQTGHTTGEPDTPKRALDEDPTTHPTDPVTAEPRHADEPPETSSGGGGDDGNNHGGGDDGNNHGGGGDDGNNHGDGDDHNNHNNDGDDGNNHGDGDDHNNHNNDGDDGNNHGHVNFDDISTPPSDPTHKYGPSPYENQHVQKWAQETAEATGIPKESILGAYDYTSQSGYSAMNPALRAEASSGTPIPPEVQTRIDNTIAGMDHLDPYSGTTYRGTGVPEDVYTHLSGGKGDYSDPAFMSSSTRPSVAEGFENNLGSDKPVSFEIEGRSGVDISPLSAYGGEAEILFRPGTKFDIIDSHLDKNGILQVKLREKP